MTRYVPIVGMEMSDKTSREAYKEAGVDVEAGYEAVERIKPLVESTYIDGVVSDLGGFGGLFKPELSGINNPLLVSGTDGVGTKLKLAFVLDKHDTVGIDCVAMCVNDIICSGASPLFFLDYIACGKNKPERIEEIVSGIAEGCRMAECALIGGETAEMPGFYDTDEYDLAGFSVGLVDEGKVIDGSQLKEGDILLGLASSGVHSNGFSLVREIFPPEETDYTLPIKELENKTLGEVLLKPTVIYVKAIKGLLKEGIKPHAISHITGGGFYENIPRMLGDGLKAEIETGNFKRPLIFDYIIDKTGLSLEEMFSTFNMGIGMVIALSPKEVKKAQEILDGLGYESFQIGKITEGEKEVVLK